MSKQIRADESAPAKIAQNVNASDSTTYSDVRGLWVGTGGTLVIVDQMDNSSSWSVADRTLLPVAVKKIMASGTSASGFIILK